MADNQDTLFREVDEELRREQLQRLWNDYGTYIVGAVAAIVLGVGGVKWWQASTQAAAEAAGSRFETAIGQISSGKSEDGRKAMQAITKGTSQGYAALAQLALSAEAVKAGNAAEALSGYEAVAARTGIDPVIRDFARLQIAALKLDSADFTEMQNRLKDLTTDASPWRYAARELAGVAALHAGKLEDARKSLEPLVNDVNAPQGVRERSGALMAMVVEQELARSVKDAAPASSPTDAPPAGGAKKN